MNTIKYHYSKGLFLSFLALGASALMSSCSNEDIPAAAGGSLADDRVAVEVQGKVAGIEAAGTRVAEDINTNSFYSSSYQNATIKINNGGTTSYSSYTYLVNANGLDAGNNKHYFPSKVDSVSVYGWYPATSNNGTSFSIKADQSSAENYVKSDLMLANAMNCTRELENNAWSVTPAALTFRHVMARMKVSITAASDITISKVVLKGVRKSVTITDSTPTALSVSLNDGDTSTSEITLFNGSQEGKGENTALDFYGVIPGASYSSSDAFLVVTAKNAKGTDVAVTFKTSSNVTLASGNVYNLNLALGQIHGNVTYTVSNWSATSGNATVSAGEFEDPAAMSTTAADIKKNALFWVAEYNLATISGAMDNTLADPATATETTFCTEHSVLKGHVNVFAWSDVVNNLTGDGKTPFTIGGYSYYVPSYAEQISVIPSDNDAGNGMNIFDQSGTIKKPTVIIEKNCYIAGAEVTGDSSYIAKFGNLDYYMVRFGKTDYASAWHYKQIPGSGLIIESYVLKNKCKNKEDAQKVLAALPYTEAWGGNANTTPAIADPSSNSVVRRFLPACGFASGTELATNYVGTGGLYWSSSEVSAGGQGAFYWYFGSDGYLSERTYAKTLGFSVRPFRSHN